MRHAIRTAILGVCLAAVTGPSSATPVLAFEPSAVVATAVTPGQSVVFFGLTRAEQRYHAVYATHREIVRDEDGDGMVRFEPPGGVPWKAVFFAVDLASGELAVASPEGFPLNEAPIAPEDVRQGPSGELDRLHVADRLVQVTVVRRGPGAGVWGGEVYDGGPGDRDADLYDEVEVDLTALASVELPETALASLVASDLILVIRPEHVLHASYRLGEVTP